MVKCIDIKMFLREIPVGTWRCNDMVAASIRRRKYDVIPTSYWKISHWQHYRNVFDTWSYQCMCNVCETLICKLVYLFNVFGEHGRYIGNINHLWWWASFSPTGFVCVGLGPRYKWWQRWDDVNCRTGVALPTGFPGQVSGRNFSEGKVM